MGSASTAVFGLSLQCCVAEDQPKHDLHGVHGCCERSHFNVSVRLLFGDSDQIVGMVRERRSADRKVVNTRAIVVWGDGLIRAFAIILDMSDSGLRIRLDREAVIGEEGYILFDHRMEPFQVAWQASRSAGLRFSMPGEG